MRFSSLYLWTRCTKIFSYLSMKLNIYCKKIVRNSKLHGLWVFSCKISKKDISNVSSARSAYSTSKITRDKKSIQIKSFALFLFFSICLVASLGHKLHRICSFSPDISTEFLTLFIWTPVNCTVFQFPRVIIETIK